MSKKLLVVIATLCITAIAWAAAEQRVDKSGSAFPIWWEQGIYVGPKNPNPTNDKLNKTTRLLGGTATIDFASTLEGVVTSSAITVKGAQPGDTCTVGASAATMALLADFACYVSAADTVKVTFMPQSIQTGSVALTSASPSTATVSSITAGSTCFCAPQGNTAAIAAGGCAASLASTTLTLTGPNTVTTTMTYRCVAPIDPASDTFRVYVRSNQ